MQEQKKKVKKIKFIGAFSELRGAELARRAAAKMQATREQKAAEEQADVRSGHVYWSALMWKNNTSALACFALWGPFR